MNLKLSNINAHGSSVKNPIIDKLLLAKIKKTFGGKTRVLFTGGAPLNHKVLKFLEAVLCVPIIQGNYYFSALFCHNSSSTFLDCFCFF